MNKQEVEQFIVDSLNVEEQGFWHPQYKASFAPFCQRQLLLSKIVGGIPRPIPFQQKYKDSVQQGILQTLHSTWTSSGVLWGDFRCSNTEACGIILRNQSVTKCPRCSSKLIYMKKEVEEYETGLKAKCDAVLFVEDLGGYVACKIHTRNENTLLRYKSDSPYPSDIYTTAICATLLAPKVKIIGRLVLWLNKAKPKPFLYWYYPDLGTSLLEEQVSLQKDLLQKIKDRTPELTVMRCKTEKDAGSCLYKGLCFRPNRDQTLISKFLEAF